MALGRCVVGLKSSHPRPSARYQRARPWRLVEAVGRGELLDRETRGPREPERGNQERDNPLAPPAKTVSGWTRISAAACTTPPTFSTAWTTAFIFVATTAFIFVATTAPPSARRGTVAAAAALRERRDHGAVDLGRAFVADLAAFGMLTRYEAPLRRELYAALHELERQKRRRAGEAIAAPQHSTSMWKRT